MPGRQTWERDICVLSQFEFFYFSSLPLASSRPFPVFYPHHRKRGLFCPPIHSWAWALRTFVFAFNLSILCTYHRDVIWATVAVFVEDGSKRWGKLVLNWDAIADEGIIYFGTLVDRDRETNTAWYFFSAAFEEYRLTELFAMGKLREWSGKVLNCFVI